MKDELIARLAAVAPLDKHSEHVIMGMQAIMIARHHMSRAAKGCGCGRGKDCRFYIEAMILHEIYMELQTSIAEASASFEQPPADKLHS